MDHFIPIFWLYGLWFYGLFLIWTILAGTKVVHISGIGCMCLILGSSDLNRKHIILEKSHNSMKPSNVLFRLSVQRSFRTLSAIPPAQHELTFYPNIECFCEVRKKAMERRGGMNDRVFSISGCPNRRRDRGGERRRNKRAMAL